MQSPLKLSSSSSSSSSPGSSNNTKQWDMKNCRYCHYSIRRHNYLEFPLIPVTMINTCPLCTVQVINVQLCSYCYVNIYQPKQKAIELTLNTSITLLLPLSLIKILIEYVGIEVCGSERSAGTCDDCHKPVCDSHATWEAWKSKSGQCTSCSEAQQRREEDDQDGYSALVTTTLF